jgi:hypothetical protein
VSKQKKAPAAEKESRRLNENFFDRIAAGGFGTLSAKKTPNPRGREATLSDRQKSFGMRPRQNETAPSR